MFWLRNKIIMCIPYLIFRAKEAMLANEERKRRLIKKRLEEENRTIINAAEASQEGKGKQAAKGEQPGSDQVIIPQGFFFFGVLRGLSLAHSQWNLGVFSRF